MGRDNEAERQQVARDALRRIRVNNPSLATLIARNLNAGLENRE